jgi:hypothetical protein
MLLVHIPMEEKKTIVRKEQIFRELTREFSCEIGKVILMI